MDKFVLQTPVIFCVFKRLDTTKRVFEKIREAQPTKLYIVSDGAREHVAGEKEKVEAVRKYIEANVDWKCEVHKNYASVNMGCGRRIPDGISWVFESENQAIILEDDCLPESSFFQYCQEMLEYYKDDERIMVIGGNNPYASCYHSEEDYLFSKVPFMWGWATWKRTWEQYDYDLKTFPLDKKNPVFKRVFPLKAYWVYMAEFESLYKQEFDAWDYQVMYEGILHDKLNIVPSESHVFNIGFHEEATHTFKVPKWMEQKVSPVHFPIRHREKVQWDEEFDSGYFKKANRHGHIVKLKQVMGLNVNRSIFEEIRKISK